MRMLLISLILFISVQVWGQAVRVLDRSDLQPIENVLIYNRNSRKTALANRNGEAKFDLLQMTDTLVFQHPSYHELELSYATIKKNRNQAFLSLRAYDLEQITVSAYRWEESRQDIPTKVTSIPAREVAFQNPQTAADLLGSSHEVFVQKSQLGGGSPMLRGFAANSVLLVVDGVRMNNAIYRSGNLHNVIALDANFIDNTEVVFGPGSVIYGSDALGGVMIFHTHQPRLSNSNTMTFSVRPLLRYSSANGEKTANILIDVGKQRWASSTVISRSEFGNLHTGSHRSSKFPEFGKRTEYVVWNGKKDSIVANKDVNVMTPSGYDQLNISQKIRFKPGANSDFIYGFHYSTSSNIPRFDRLIEYRSGKLRFAEWYYGPQKWMMHNLNIRLYDSNFFFNNSKITLAYQFNEESRHDRRLNQFVRTSRIEKVHAFILNADFQKLISGHSSLFYGIEGFYNDVLSKARAEDIRTNAISPASTRYPDGSNQYAGLAGYAMLKKRLSSTFVLHTGLRYSRVMLESILKDTVFYNFPFRKISIHAGALNGIAGLTTHLTPDIQINTNFSTGFRAPNLDDAGKVFESAPGNVVVPNPNLKPEYAINGEIGLIYTCKHWLQAEVSAFYTHLTDVMVRRDFTYLGRDSIIYNGELSKVQAIVNAGKGYITGASVVVRLELVKNLNLRSTITYTYGKESGTENPMPLSHISPLFGAISLTFNTHRTRLDASVVYNAAKKWTALDPSEQAKTHMYTPEGSLAWFTINIKASYQVLPQMQLNAGIENILDKFYWPYASGIPASGRNIYVALRGNLAR